MKKLIFIFFLLILFTGCKKACKNIIGPASGNHLKILFIGLDGVRTDAFRAANTPHFDSLAENGIRCWYVDRGPFTVSVPGWTTILHGVFPAKHGLTKNSFTGNNYEQYPDIFKMVRKMHQNWQLFSLTNWADFMKITSQDTYCLNLSDDALLAAKAVDVLTNFNPDILLLHFNGPDHTGHASGFSPLNPDYISNIEQMDIYAGAIFNAVQIREQLLGEEWMTIVCTDHGGEGTSHGDQDNLRQTRFVFFIVSGKNIPSFEKTSPTSNTDLLPTMLKFMNVAVDPSAGLDGVSLY